MTADPIADGTIEAFLADSRFNQLFVRPAVNENDDALCISYADFGYRNEESPEQENVLLFFGPLVASRMMQVAKDKAAKAHKVRIIHPDRPGFGRTPDVEPSKRLPYWREAILALLQHLQIRHVSLATHSGGTVYALDLLLHHPELLHPDRPGYIAMGSPWIHTSHSGVWHLQLAQALPRAVLSHTDKLASWFTMVSAPLMNKSLDFATSMQHWLSLTPAEDNLTTDNANAEEIAFAEALDEKLADCIFGNSVAGISNEAILLLQRPNDPGKPGWSDWGDYDTLIPRLRQALNDNNRRLTVEVFLGETDSMTGNPGTAGSEWFLSCWKTSGAGDPITFSSRVVPSSDHNSIWATRWGVARHVFERLENHGPADVDPR